MMICKSKNIQMLNNIGMAVPKISAVHMQQDSG